MKSADEKREYGRKWRQEHPDYYKNYYQKHKLLQEYYEDRENHLKYNRVYYQQHRQELLLKQAEYRRLRKEKKEKELKAAIRKIRKLPVEVEAVQYTGKNQDEVKAFVGANGSIKSKEAIVLKGGATVHIGDFIIKGMKGEFYPCRRDIFRKIYKRANR
jgi:mRNA degradation ribonuclease J1/J2